MELFRRIIQEEQLFLKSSDEADKRENTEIGSHFLEIFIKISAYWDGISPKPDTGFPPSLVRSRHRHDQRF